MEHTSVLTPKGGPSIKLGVDDISEFVLNELHWRNNEAVISLARRHTNIDVNQSTREAAALSIAHHDTSKALIEMPRSAAVDQPIDYFDESTLMICIEGGQVTLEQLSVHPNDFPWESHAAANQST